jgi:hypothetical protein
VYSENGMTWKTDLTSYNNADIMFVEGTWLRLNINRIEYSTDLITWTRSDLDIGTNQVAFGDNMLIAATTAGLYYSKVYKAVD